MNFNFLDKFIILNVVLNKVKTVHTYPAKSPPMYFYNKFKIRPAPKSETRDKAF